MKQRPMSDRYIDTLIHIHIHSIELVSNLLPPLLPPRLQTRRTQRDLYGYWPLCERFEHEGSSSRFQETEDSWRSRNKNIKELLQTLVKILSKIL